MNIILIGFMAVGKGTLARYLAKELDVMAIDTDDLIESLENRKIKKIFATNGEEYFRSLEKKVALWLESSVKDTIISTGGGFYKQENIKKIGKVLYLKNSFENILDRVYSSPNAKAKIKKRPLLKDIEKARELYNIRIKEYEKVADYIIDMQKDKKEILEEIKKIWLV